MNKFILAIVCFFLGVFGIHRFVVGKFWTGILYLFTGGLLMIGVIVDFIRILMGTFDSSVKNK